jgi:LysR family glycine cleavage system transcriptional activator
MPVSPPRPKGPPLNSLRAFEASARLGGFAAAAQELFVTPGAISQQVKILEQWAGADLFERRSQGVVLTPLGAAVGDQFVHAFDSLSAAVRSLRSNANLSTINIATLPGIGHLWVSPRMPAIRAALPGHTISVTALESPPNLQREWFDICVFLAPATSDGSDVLLGEDVIVPVCSPVVAARLKSPGDLFNETWLYDSSWEHDWQHWIDAALPALGKAKPGPLFSLYSIAVQEAINSAGVLMGHQALVASAIERGDLVAPFSAPVKTGMSLVLTAAAEQPFNEALRIVIDMLSAEQ